jgi:hyperosmotically inducible protein
MNTHIGPALAAALLVVSSAAAEATTRTDRQVLRDVQRAVTGSGWFTIFDDIHARVDHGIVTLTGRVTMPYKRDDIVRRVSRVEGLVRLVDQVQVLPLSRFDDELRLRLARAIYGNANFSNYAMMANPPIHIIVERGRVTLTGIVQSHVDRMLARALATQPGVMTVVNNLRTEQEVRATADEF